MKRSKFYKPKQVLIFNGACVLVGITRSIRSAAEISGSSAQSISFACTGRYVSAGAHYYRHIHPDVEIEVADLDSLKLQEYDGLCKNKKRYNSKTEMTRRRKLINEKRKSISLPEDPE